MTPLGWKPWAGLAVLVFVLSGVAVERWWAHREGALSADIARLTRDNAASLGAIQARDARLLLLARHDSALVKVVTKQTGALAAAEQRLAATRAKIDADAALHGGLVPIAQVHVVEARGDSALMDCKNLASMKDSRIANLEAQIANRDTTRHELDTVVVRKDSVLARTTALLRAPWWKRSFSWIGDHGVTLAIGVVGGYAIAKR